ncbi:MAG: anthranilate phosphoribosyltransferase [Nitrospirae bacterium]|nr:anthranilate phosphoribosyltransferase [Nitrospirota bacterium]
MIKEAIAKVVDSEDLAEEDMQEVMNEIMTGGATPAQIASFITALRVKGETVDEITGAARVMREKAARITAKDSVVVDTCGTGGDMAQTFNVSTTAAFVVAGTGLMVAKHGNRSVSSACGSADVLQALGVNIDLKPAEVERCLNEIGIGFLFAPLFHEAMKFAVGPRKEIGIRTIFNILGPLTNPAGAKAQVLGVYSHSLTEIMAKVLMKLGASHCFVVHGSDGLDEITITTTTKVSEGKNGKVRTYTVKPSDFGLRKAKKVDLLGGDAAENAKITMTILSGEKGPKRDIVLLNAAAAIVAGCRAKTLKEGVKLAAESIDSGAAMNKLEAMKRFTNQ